MTRIEQREQTAAAWASQNPVLLKGELGWESGAVPKAKKGDGITAYNDLPYAVLPQPDTATFAPTASPTFTGDPKAPTPATADNDTSLATTAFVKAQGYAPLASPTFTGDPKAPTPATSDNDTSVATTAFVKAAIAALVAGSPTLLDTLDELAAALGDDPNFAASMATALGLKAPLLSPTFTGDPKAPTPVSTDNDTSIATTAFVKTAVQPLLDSSFVNVTPSDSAYTGTIVCTRVGNIVYASGSFARASSFDSAYHTVANIPLGYRPTAAFSPPAAVWNATTDSYQFSVATNGNITLRESAARSISQSFVGSWPTADAAP